MIVGQVWFLARKCYDPCPLWYHASHPVFFGDKMCAPGIGFEANLKPGF